MTCSRFYLPGFGLLLLGTVIAGFYLYQNLPDLLRLQSQQYLQQYGVDDIEFEGLHITRRDMTAETLVLRGTYNNYAYQATLTSAKIQYNWRVLFGAKIDSLSLSSLSERDLSLLCFKLLSERSILVCACTDVVAKHRTAKQIINFFIGILH